MSKPIFNSPSSNQGGKIELRSSPVGLPTVDYLTLTTFDTMAYTHALGVLSKISGSWQPYHIRGYYGFFSPDGCFYGSSLQCPAGGVLTEHYMLQMHGTFAHIFLQHAWGARWLEDFKCTRIDVQYTPDVEVPFDVSFRAFADVVSLSTFGRGRPPKVTLIDGSDGLHTLYIGVRSSPRMQRIYVKELGSSRYARWETEFKGQLSQECYGKMLGASSLSEFLHGIMAVEIGWYSVGKETLPVDFWAALAQIEDGQERLKVARRVPDAICTYQWLERAVIPTVRRFTETDSLTQELVIIFYNRVTEVMQAMPNLDDVEGETDDALLD